MTGTLYFEFTIPRMGKRIDVVLLSRGVIFVIEFKVGSASASKAAADQCWDYALDLKNFHETSHALQIVPVIVATESESTLPSSVEQDRDGVFHPVAVSPKKLRDFLDNLSDRHGGRELASKNWEAGSYRPTPTIIEAARALYSQHSVESIARNDAGAKNLRLTSETLESIISKAQSTKRKVVCLVTGVPGAGKTLVGLNIATQRREAGSTHAVYLSGNDPLIRVLSEALAQDEYERRMLAGESVKKGEIRESVKAFIQNVHHFRDEGLRDLAANKPPSDRVAIFDEAQRAWTVAKTADFMQRRKGISGFEFSEPAFLISYMDRHPDWAAVICLVGGGQEIHSGEAGIGAWLDALTESFPNWDLYLSSKLTDSEFGAGDALERALARPNTVKNSALHLSSSMRSFRAENVSAFVKALLDLDHVAAQAEIEKLRDKYPIVVARDLLRAKAWLREQARGTERYGLLASSNAQRLKPHAIDVRVKADPVHWFLKGTGDTRSSLYLEDAATEFQVQGLEVDWACVTWDADLRKQSDNWTFHNFRGDKWTNVQKLENKRYLLNAYRVLMTRARQGMVIFVPTGDLRDPTRSPAYYDHTFRYLKDVGLTELK